MRCRSSGHQRSSKRSTTFSTVERRSRSTARAIGARQKPEAVAAALAALRDRPDANPGLSAVRVPTLVIVGEEDAVTPPSAAKALAGGIPGAKLVTIPQAGHLSNLEAPEAFNAAVRAFLVGLS